MGHSQHTHRYQHCQEQVDVPAQKGCHGTIACYKAHLVAQGFTQTYGINYDETFAPVAKLASTCVVLALAAIHNWEVHQSMSKMNISMWNSPKRSTWPSHLVSPGGTRGQGLQTAQSPVQPETWRQVLVPAHLRSIRQVWLYALPGRPVRVLQKSGTCDHHRSHCSRRPHLSLQQPIPPPRLQVGPSVQI